MVLADAASKVLTFGFFLVSARHLGAAQFGVVSFAFAIVTMLVALSDLGLGVVSSREIARDPSRASSEVHNALAIKFAVSFLLMALAVFGVRLLHYPPAAVRAVTVSSLFIPSSAVALYLGFVFQGFEKMALSALTRVVQAAVLVSGAIILSAGQAVAERYVWLFVAAAGLGAAFSLVAASVTLVRPGLSFRFRQWLLMLKRSYPVGLAAACVVVYYWNGSALLSKFQGNVAVGIFSAPFRVVLGLGFIPAAIAGALFPVMSRLAGTDEHRLTRVFNRALRYAVLLALPIGILGVFLAHSAVSLLYGKGYEGSVPVMAVLAWWAAFGCFNAILSHYFYALAKSKLVAAQAACSLVINIFLNVLLIPRFGPVGAAVSLAGAELGGVVFHSFNKARIYRRIGFRILLVAVLKASIAAGAAGLVSLAVPVGSPLWRFVAAGITFILLAVLFGLVRPDDMIILRRLLRRREPSVD